MANMPELRNCRTCNEDLPLSKFEKLKAGGKVYAIRGECYRCRQGKAPARDQVMPTFDRRISGKRFLITCAQNNTPAHEPFLQTLKVAAKHLGAEIIVVPLRYKNPTNVREANKSLRWDEALTPYLFNQRRKLGPNLVLVGDVKIQPTAKDPLTGFESLTGRESCIIGHPKMALNVIPGVPGAWPKQLSTTGAVTRGNNYSDTKAGAIGEFHHYLGAVLVELRGRHFWIRQINADRVDGSFIDLDKLYTVNGVQKAPPPLGFDIGDTHERYTDPRVDRATFGPGGLVPTLDPGKKSVVAWNDVGDGDSANPHHEGNPFIAAAKQKAGLTSVRDELLAVVEFVNSRADGRRSVIVDSNHPDFISRWVLKSDWKHVGHANMAFYLESAQAMLESARITPNGAEYMDPFGYWVRKLGLGDNIRVLGPNESFKLGPVEVGMHGHRGANGAKGSLRGFSRLGEKTITGHSHTPGIREGAYAVGTSTPLRLEYTKGPSSWLNTHCVVYANGKRALITIIEGRWRA